MPLIKAFWEARLGAHSLRVIGDSNFSKLETVPSSAFDSVFADAGRQPTILVSPEYERLTDDQIDRLTAPEHSFEAPYLFWSFLRPDKVSIYEAALVESQDNRTIEIARFGVEKKDGGLLGRSDHTIQVDAPSESGLRSISRKWMLSFYLANGTIPRAARLGNCQIQLILITGGNTSPAPPLRVGTSAARKKSHDLLDRVLTVALFGCVPLGVRLLAYLGFACIPRSERRAELRRKYFEFINKAAPYIDGLLIAVACVLTLSWMVLLHPMSFVLAPVVTALMGMFGGLLGFFVVQEKIERRHKLWPEIVVVGLEFMVYFIAR